MINNINKAATAIMFDMDGVIIDTRQSVIEFWNYVAAKLDVTLSPADFDRHIFGCPSSRTLDKLFPNLDQATRQWVFDMEVEFEKKAIYTPIRGAIALLTGLRAYHIPLGLVTSRQPWEMEGIYRQVDVESYFSVVVTSGDITQGKPHPACYLKGAELLKTPPETCLVFEDSVSGVSAGSAAGALCIGVQPSESIAKDLLDIGAAAVVPDLTQVTVSKSREDHEIYLSLNGNGRIKLKP
jgi:sugar-phosphatase